MRFLLNTVHQANCWLSAVLLPCGFNVREQHKILLCVPVQVSTDLSMLIAQRLKMEAVHNITSIVMRPSQMVVLRVHTPSWNWEADKCLSFNVYSYQKLPWHTIWNQNGPSTLQFLYDTKFECMQWFLWYFSFIYQILFRLYFQTIFSTHWNQSQLLNRKLKTIKDKNLNISLPLLIIKMNMSCNCSVISIWHMKLKFHSNYPTCPNFGP